MKDIVVLGGPNGAGKTTTAKILLPEKLHIREFVNADEIARGLSPFNPDEAAFAAGRAMIGRMQELMDQDTSFAFETTCSALGHVHFLERCKREGWRVTLLYLWLATPEQALRRVERRVREGGHSIPPTVVIRRYWLGLTRMLSAYLPLADIAHIYDNSDSDRDPVLMAERLPETGSWFMISIVGQR